MIIIVIHRLNRFKLSRYLVSLLTNLITYGKALVANFPGAANCTTIGIDLRYIQADMLDNHFPKVHI